MRIGNRLFPYPVLNRQETLNCYKNSTFSFECDMDEDDNHLLLENIRYSNTNNTIQNLIDEGKIKVDCIVECSSTIFRERYELTDVPSLIRIPMGYLKDKIVISCYAYATEDIYNFNDEDFLDEYTGFKFHIEKFDILACDDGFTTKIKYDENIDNKVSSIFMVIKNIESQDEKAIIKETPSKINILLPEDQFNIYDKTKLTPLFTEIYFSFLVIPALIYVLQKYNKDDIDDLRMRFDWFLSIEQAYKNIYGKDLDNEAFERLSSVEFAQEIMNFPVTKGIDNFFRLTMFDSNRGDDDE